MKTIKSLIEKNKDIIIYFGCSVFAALFEAGLLLVFKKFVPLFNSNIVIANTFAIIISSFIHYIITSKFVFKVSFSWKSALVYIVTFFIGLGIQNSVIWIMYNRILNGFIKNDSLLTISSKVISLAASFFITFFIRKKLNSMIKEQKKETENE